MTANNTPELSAVAATLAANLPAPKAYLPRPREVARDLQEHLAVRGYTLKIEWLWVGRNRHGAVHIFDRSGDCVYSREYARNETRWDENDEALTSCNRASNKHFALIAALKFMSCLPHRKCVGLSDSHANRF